MRLLIPLCQLLLGLNAGCQASAGPAPPVDPLRLLFIGNSLTYTNDLPAMVASIVSLGGRDEVEVQQIAYPNYGLTEHRLRGEAEAAIRRGGWTLVILQQGPSSLPDSRIQLVAESRWFAAVAREAGVPLGLLMVWPDQTRLAYFGDVATSYRVAADSIGALLLPAGEAWREAWRTDPQLPLFGPDGFHPAPLGSLLAALVIVDRLAPGAFDHLTSALPEFGSVTPAQLRVAMAAARTVNRRAAP